MNENDGQVPDESIGDVIAGYPDGTIVLDDGITTWNPRRAEEFKAKHGAYTIDQDVWAEFVGVWQDRYGYVPNTKDADDRSDYETFYLGRAAAAAEIGRLTSLIDTPHTSDFLKAVPLEAAHQIKRWGVEHDEGKQPEDWFWLVGYLAGKALHAAKTGDIEKAKHHTISTAACMLNWHRRLTGDDATFQPGINSPDVAASARNGERDATPETAVSPLT
jgi:hypothetical protein